MTPATDGAHRLPLALDGFVGREAELAEVVALAGPGRLVTVTGPAGVGKTRLAVEAARVLGGGYDDGAVFVSLAATGDHASVAAALAAALGVGDQPGRDLVSTLGEYLAERRLVLVVDNCEQVAAGAAALVGGLLGRCAGLAVVATSREALGVAGEQVWALAPLAVPDVGADDVDAVGAAASVQLFCQRASAISPGFALSAENAAALGEICRRLDGLALAVELAATWVTVLAPAEIAARLADRFGLLAGGAQRAVPDRHRNLQAALDWSHDLCRDAEQVLLRRLSVFAGGASLDAVTAVCSGAALEPLAALVAKSLVVADTGGESTRYRMLETIRHYAGDRLGAAGEVDALRLRHARWFAALAEGAEPGLSGADQRLWLDRLGVEADNLAAALHWALAQGQTVLALRLAGALSLWWRVRGSFGQARGYLDAALALPGDVPAGLRAKAAWGAALMAVMVGDFAGAAPLAEQALGLYRGLGDTAGWARALLVAANCQVFAAPLAAQPLLEQSIALARQAGDDWCLAHALALAALSHHNQGEPVAARALIDEAVVVARRSHDAQGLRIALALLGEIALAQGDLDVAEAAAGEALTVTGDLGETYGTAAALLGLGEVALARGDHGQAGRRLDRGIERARAAGTLQLVVDALCLQARLAQATGDLDTAARLYKETLSVATQAGCSCGPALRGLGEVAAARGDHDTAGHYLDQALAMVDPGDHRSRAAVLHNLADLARTSGDHEQAVTLHHQALAVRRRIGDRLGLVQSLEALGGLAASTSRRKGPYAARLLGAADAQRKAHGFGRAVPPDHHDDDLAALQEFLGADQLDAAWAQGAKLSLEKAVAYAARDRGVPGRPRRGWAALTTADRQVAAMAAAGMTNPEIAAQLFVDTDAVKIRLRRVFTKLGIRSRVELARMWPPGPTSPD